MWGVSLVFPHRGSDGRRDQGVGRFQAREEQEVAVYFSHFLFEAPLVSLLLPTPSAFTADTGLTQTHLQYVHTPLSAIQLKLNKQICTLTFFSTSLMWCLK